MSLQDDVLDHLWTNRINAYMQEDWIDKEIEMSQRHPDWPFADIGPILARLLALGATRRELSCIARMAEYNGIYDAFYALGEHSGGEQYDHEALAESLLMADPSGLDGGPGSAPEKD